MQCSYTISLFHLRFSLTEELILHFPLMQQLPPKQTGDLPESGVQLHWVLFLSVLFQTAPQHITASFPIEINKQTNQETNISNSKINVEAAVLYYEIQIPSPQPWVLDWVLCSWKVRLAWHWFYWLGRKKSSCIWALSLKSTVRDRKAAFVSGGRECQSTALQSWSQFISGHRWGTWINHNPNRALTLENL